MNGPIKKPKIGMGLGALEAWSVVFGLIVVLGVLLESGPEFWQSARHLQIPPHVAIGGALVALGVFGEVAIGVFIARYAKREQIESSERIAKAEQATADADLKRVALEASILRRALSRKLKPEEQTALIESLFGYAGQEFALYISSAGEQTQDPEQVLFALELNSILWGAGWKQVVNEPVSTPLIARGVVIFSQGAYAGKATIALQSSLAKLQISCQLAFNSPPVPIIIGVGPI